MTPGRSGYPLPEAVGRYGSREAFDASRWESGQWVFWADRVEHVLAGRYDEVKPLHVEVSPTYLCNFACPWCSCRSAREVWSDENVFEHPQASPGTVMSCEALDRVVDRLSMHGVGIQWVGGEPTMHPGLLPAVARARDAGLTQCLFTNGSVLGPRRIEALLDAELAFIRVSLDAVTEDVHQRHHGYRAGRPYGRIVLANLRELVERRHRRGAATEVGVSLVVDERNIDDVEPTATFIRELCEEHGAGAVDFVIVRPTYQFYAAQCQLEDGTAQALRQLVERGSALRTTLEQYGVKVVAPEASFATSPEEAAGTVTGEACLSCGWFAEVTPTGEMLLCSDRYGNPDYAIGSLAEHSLDDVWGGEQRQRVLAMAEETACFRTRCPRNGRGFQLNTVFHEVERLRQDGRIDEVASWVADLREVLPAPKHSFFL
jgi:MoaA/NifB/PqqE/SkfB family radical SAM enzyme